MKVVNLTMMGRFGNQLFQYAFARKYAELSGAELRTESWIGEILFEIAHPPIKERFKVVRSDLDFSVGEGDIELRAYAQSQRALIYTKEEVRGWFALKGDLKKLLELSRPGDDQILGHARRGDYFGYGYPVVSIGSYQRAVREHGLSGKLQIISEENPTMHPGFAGELSFLPDFYRLMRAEVLLRGNSTFSWWAGTLGREGQRVFSPVIDGLEGGREHDVRFVEGNYPRLANTSFTTDLFLK